MGSKEHATFSTLFVMLAFVFGICVGAKLGIAQTKKAYGYSHERLFIRK